LYFAKAGFYENEINDNDEYENVQQLCTSMDNSHSVNDFINFDKNIYTDNDNVNVNFDQLKIYKEALIYIKNLEQFSMNKIYLIFIHLM